MLVENSIVLTSHSSWVETLMVVRKKNVEIKRWAKKGFCGGLFKKKKKKKKKKKLLCAFVSLFV